MLGQEDGGDDAPDDVRSEDVPSSNRFGQSSASPDVAKRPRKHGEATESASAPTPAARSSTTLHGAPSPATGSDHPIDDGHNSVAKHQNALQRSSPHGATSPRKHRKAHDRSSVPMSVEDELSHMMFGDKLMPDHDDASDDVESEVRRRAEPQ